jgi:hypothetical protein
MTAFDPQLAARIAEAGVPLSAHLVQDAVLSARQYPIRPRPDEDSRFTFGFALDVAKVLKEHGYPAVTSGRDFLELQQALFGFLYGGPDGEVAS